MNRAQHCRIIKNEEIDNLELTEFFQKQGLGRLLMEKIMDYLHSQLKTGYRFMVCLMAAKGKEEFYKKFGFIDRPNENFGCGMHQWLEA